MIFPPLFNPLEQPTSSQMVPSCPITVLNVDSRFWVKKSRLLYENSCSSSMTADLLIQRSLKTSAMNNRRKSLAYLMSLKIKNYEVTIKGRGCTYGRKKRNWISKEDASSPTVSTEGLILSFIIGSM